MGEFRAFCMTIIRWIEKFQGKEAVGAQAWQATFPTLFSSRAQPWDFAAHRNRIFFGNSPWQAAQKRDLR
ncbi:MAG: hypothetical protein ABIM40_10435, partial [Pseudomonadota bacterium]